MLCTLCWMWLCWMSFILGCCELNNSKGIAMHYLFQDSKHLCYLNSQFHTLIHVIVTQTSRVYSGISHCCFAKFMHLKKFFHLWFPATISSSIEYECCYKIAWLTGKMPVQLLYIAIKLLVYPLLSVTMHRKLQLRFEKVIFITGIPSSNLRFI